MLDYKLIDWPRVKLEQRIHKGTDQTIYTFDIETSSGFIPELMFCIFDVSLNNIRPLRGSTAGR